MPLIVTEKLTHIYSAGTPFEHTAIRDVDFEAERGQFIGVIGATGSGKSTFIQHLNGLLKPYSGRVLFDGRDIRESKDFTRNVRFKVGLVFQYPEYQLFETTVFDDIAFGPRNMGLSESEIRERVLEAAEFASLTSETMHKSPFELSGGQKRRAAIAGVIAMRPEILILDEPTAGLDPRGRDEIIENILKYKRAAGAAVITVTHSMEILTRTADRIVAFSGGTLAMQGTPSHVFSQTDRLAALGLAQPAAASLANRLRTLGLPLRKDIFTREQLAHELIELKKGSRHA